MPPHLDFLDLTMQAFYYISESSLSTSVCRMKVMRGNSQFYLNIPLSDVGNSSPGQDFLSLIEQYRALKRMDTEAYDKFIDLICLHFLPLFVTLAQETSVYSLTLEDFVHAPTYHFQVSDSENGNLEVRGEQKVLHSPAYDIVPLSSSSAPDFWKHIPRSQARDLSLALPESDMNPLRAVQGKVRTAQGSYRYFKPRQEGREDGFNREVKILHHIKDEGLTGSHFRLPILDSLVVADTNGEVVIGMLTNLITSPDLGSHLLSPGFRDRVDLHRRWHEQVRTSVQLLHSHDLVWGDVNPCNVAIDEDFDAWVIDFGGMNNAEFVDDDKTETKDGD
jgi:tRNA A-37 threonylcarbamoyl transferase component Bud32